MSAESEYRYNRLTWTEINDAIEMQKLVDELREWPIEKWLDQHLMPVQMNIRF